MSNLLNIMVHDLSICLQDCEMSQIADDGALWKPSPCITALPITKQQD